jgi:MFS family permease
MTDSKPAESIVAKPSWRASTLAPFRTRIYFWIWAASLASNLGSLIQAVGASWLMTSLAPSPDMVALVQASTTLPIMFLSLPAGAVADIWDRRWVMLIAQSLLLAVSVVLALMTWLGHLNAWTLLTFTFLIGCGTALYGPSWQSSVGEQVPREQLPAAIALNILSFNIARTVGPAIGGVLVAASGPHAAFIANAISYIGLIVVLSRWRRPKPARVLPPESMGMAMLAGLRYARLSPQIRVVLIRALVFGMLASAIWALMPVIARDLLHGGALTYGFLFGAFGAGAVLGGAISVPVRQRLLSETLVRITSAAFGLTAIIAAFSHWLAVSMLGFVLGGASWVLALSTFNITIQTWSPRWVLGRTMAIYQMVTFGGMAIGSWLWGLIAHHGTIPEALLLAGSALIAAVLIGVKLPIAQPQTINLDPSRTWPEPKSRVDLAAESGPVVVTIEYRVAEQDRDSFLAAMHELQRIRRRDGARRWTLLQDVAEPDLWIERFQSPSWVEHIRQHHRFTVADRDVERRVLAFHRGTEPPVIRHFLERTPVPAEEITGPEPIGERATVSDPNLPAAALPPAEAVTQRTAPLQNFTSA